MQWLQEPALVAEILGRIQSISDEAQRALGDPELDRATMVSGLEVCLLTLNSQRDF